MTLKVTRQLNTTVDSGRYKAEFDGSDIYVHDTENSQRIVFSGTMEEAREITNILALLDEAVRSAEVIIKNKEVV